MDMLITYNINKCFSGIDYIEEVIDFDLWIISIKLVNCFLNIKEILLLFYFNVPMIYYNFILILFIIVLNILMIIYL